MAFENQDYKLRHGDEEVLHELSKHMNSEVFLSSFMTSVSILRLFNADVAEKGFAASDWAFVCNRKIRFPRNYSLANQTQRSE